MKKLIDSYGKQVLAVLGVILMISYFTPSGMRNAENEAGNKTVATIFGTDKITAYTAEQYVGDYDALRRLNLRFPPDLTAQRFMLLAMEANKYGITVSDEQIKTAMNSFKTPLEEDSPLYDQIYRGVGDFLAINHLLSSVGGAAKISGPAARYYVASTMQQMSAYVAEIPVGRYAAPAATQPSRQQIDDQYGKFSANVAGETSADNELGFGYAYPDRVSLQYIGFARSDARQAVIDSRSQIDWLTKARRYYREHASDFSFSTPAGASATQPSAVLAWEQLPGEDMRQTVLNRVYDNATDDLSTQIEKQITTTLAQDWAVYHAAASTTQPSSAAPATTLGPAFASQDYLQALSDSLVQSFHIRPIIGYTGDQPKSARDIDAIDPFGKAATADGAAVGDFAASHAADTTAGSQLNFSDRLALYQPSPSVYVGGSFSPADTFVFRITSVDPSHPMPEIQVSAQVIRDLQTQAGWTMARADADKLIAAAAAGGLKNVAATLTPAPVIVLTGMFGSSELSSTVPGIALSPGSETPFINAAMDLLGTVTAADMHPLGKVDLPADGIVAVIQVDKLARAWPPTYSESQAVDLKALQQQGQILGDFRKDWIDNVEQRTQYKETK